MRSPTELVAWLKSCFFWNAVRPSFLSPTETLESDSESYDETKHTNEATVCLRTLLNGTYLRGLMIVSIPFELCHAIRLMSLKFRGIHNIPRNTCRGVSDWPTDWMQGNHRIQRRTFCETQASPPCFLSFFLSFFFFPAICFLLPWKPSKQPPGFRWM